MIKTSSTTRAAAKPSGPMNKAEAQAITQRIKGGFEDLCVHLRQAVDRAAWKALGYPSWKDYTEREFGFSRQRCYQLLDQGRVIEAVRDAIAQVSTTVDAPSLISNGFSPQITEREARDIKADLTAVTADIQARVEAGEEPQRATGQAIAARRAEKESERERKRAEKAAADAAVAKRREEMRAQMSPEMKKHEAAKKDRAKPKPDSDLADRVEELDQTNRALEREVEALRTENKLFADMKVQWENGGFEEVVRNLESTIRVLEGRVEQESTEKVRNLRSMEWWKQQAIACGFSRDLVIDAAGEVVSG